MAMRVLGVRAEFYAYRTLYTELTVYEHVYEARTLQLPVRGIFRTFS